MNKINVIGSMPGLEFTKAEQEIINNADIIFAGSRNIGLLENNKKPVKKIEKMETAINDIKNEFNNGRNVVVIASGNPLFFGIGSTLIRYFGSDNINIVPHIGSVDVAMSRLKIPENNVYVISLHGRPIKGLAQRIKHYKKMIILTDQINSPSTIAKYMIEFNLTYFRFVVCERLGYNDEKIQELKITDAAKQKFSSPNLVYIEAEKLPENINFSDDHFLMVNDNITKEEIRDISLSKMEIKNGDILWDVGSGTGSVSIMACENNYDGKIYSIEKNKEACINIEKNMKNFSCDLNIVNGDAPEVLERLPDPDVVFIGGSGGKIIDIIDYSYKRLKNSGRMVINTVIFENLKNAMEFFNKNYIDYDLVHALISRKHGIKNNIMLKPLDPVYILRVIKK